MVRALRGAAHWIISSVNARVVSWPPRPAAMGAWTWRQQTVRGVEVTEPLIST